MHAAWELPEAARAAFLLESCGHDPQLLSEVRSLVEARHQADNWSPSTAPPATTHTRRFGAYQLEKMIGRGGMGAVYLAHRDDGSFQQKVAIKIVGLPFELEPMRQRFKRERQILAALNHPNIAHLIDGGVTEEGELYIAMEYIDGLPLDQYVSVNQLALGTKLGLFRQIAAAVSYAHQNLIIHRDLKPSNILVTAQGLPKLLDFGTAKLLSPENTPSITGTIAGFLTVSYASPEHLRGGATSTLSDVYSLGAILYELISGHPAFPSDLASRLDPLSASAFPQPIAGDLNLIVRKALDPDPTLRYASVEQLSEDVRRFNAGEPVLAHPAALAYRAKKFLRRHSFTVALSALFLIGMTAATGFSFYQARTARRQAEVAREQSARSQRLAQFASDTLIAVSPNVFSPLSGHSGPINLSDILDNAATRVGPQFANDPENEAVMRTAIGRAYLHLGLTEKAQPLLHQGVFLTRKLGAGNERRLAQALLDQCNLYNFRSDFSTARRLCQESLDTQKRASPPDYALQATISHDLAYMMFYDGADPAAVERFYRESAAMQELATGTRNPHWCDPMVRVGELRLRAGRIDEAESILRDVLARMSSFPGPPVEIVESLRALAVLERTRGNFQASEDLLSRAIVVLDKRPVAFFSRVQFETERLYTQILAGQAGAVLPRAQALLQAEESDPEIRARRLMVYGLALARTNRRQQAEPILRQSAAFFQQLPANRAIEKAEAASALAECRRP